MPLSKPSSRTTMEAPAITSSAAPAPRALPSASSAALPDDLEPIPAYPPNTLYPTLLPIAPGQARSAIWHASGNLTSAAALLQVTPARLASLVARDPFLASERRLAAELLIDRAEQVMAEELNTENAPDAARWLLDRAGRSRGYGKDAPVLSFGGGTSGAIAIRWESE